MYGYEDYLDYGTSAAVGTIFAGLGVMWVISLIVGLLMIISMWKLFSKAGRSGWAAIIPIYNIYIMIDIAGLSAIYLLLLIIPVVNIYAIFKIYIELAKKFGQGVGYGVAMVFFSVILLPVLAFGSSEYEG